MEACQNTFQGDGRFQSLMVCDESLRLYLNLTSLLPVVRSQNRYTHNRNNIINFLLLTLIA